MLNNETTMLQNGDFVPQNIKLVKLDGTQTDLSEQIGKKYVLYFYPKDDTPGCTIEACEFRDYNKDIKKLGYEIIGVSVDPIKAHQKFINKHGLNFTLLSDIDHKLNEAFGIWVEKSMFGRRYMGTLRSTYAIDEVGKIIMSWQKVKPEGHAKDVYEYLSFDFQK